MVTCIQAPFFLERILVLRFGSPHASAAMPIPVDGLPLVVSWSGGA
jgi:hypothetical protein